MVNDKVLQFRKAIWQIPALIVLAAITAMLTNAWRSDGIPFVGDWSVKARFSDTTGDTMFTSLELAADDKT